MINLLTILLACSPPQTSDTGDSGSTTHSDTPEDDGMDSVDTSLLLAGDNPCREPVLVTVQYMVDGDTAWVEGVDGREKVRFIGIDTPEIGHDGEADDCYAGDALAFGERLIEGARVWLTFDVECEDYFDRTLAYVHMGTGSQDFVQRRMLQGGYAEAFEVSPNSTFAEIFTQDEEMAQNANIGRWAECP